MRFRGRCGPLPLVLGLTLAGCGPDDGYTLARVSGRVTYEGKPLEAGFITFMPDDQKQTVGPLAMSKISEGGRYSMSTKEADDGAVLGFHRVGIMGIDPKPIIEVSEEDLTPERIMTTKSQQGRRRPTRKEGGPSFTDRGGSVYRILTPEKLKSPETSGVTVEIKGGSNTLNFHVKEDGTVQVEP